MNRSKQIIDQLNNISETTPYSSEDILNIVDSVLRLATAKMVTPRTVLSILSIEMDEKELQDQIMTAEIWEITKKDNYNTGSVGEKFIITHLEEIDGIDFVGIGCFWILNEKRWGGMRVFTLTKKEVREIGKRIGSIPEMLENILKYKDQ